MRMMQQLQLQFGAGADDDKALWTPRDIWVHLDQRHLEFFKEDRRLERKGGKSQHVDLDLLATYYSTFSNTSDGGVLVYGIEDKGEITDCSRFSQKSLNEIESFHVQRCPGAKPEFKRFAVVVDNAPGFCIAIYIPYVGKLIETNKGEAWIRYGDKRHLMCEEERRDFMSTRNQTSFELDPAPHAYPADFDLRIIQDFCDSFRTRESRSTWSNEEVLIDRHLLNKDGVGYKALNSLVLLASLDPRTSIPGCRVRVQRFGTEQEGTGATYSPLQDKFVEGNVIKLIKDGAELIGSSLYDVTWLHPEEGKFVTTTEYPRWAWFEALVNACVHRSYSFSGSDITVKMFPGRMEIESPGGFVPPVSEDTIYVTRSNRNAHLMDAIRYLGYVRMAREGVRRIRESMKEMHLPDPQFKQETLYGVVVRVTLKNDHETRKRATDRDVATYFGVALWKTLEEHEVKIAAYAYHNLVIQVSGAQRLTGRTWSSSKKDLERLTKKGVLVFSPGKYVRDPKASYRLAGMEEKEKK